MRLLNYIHASEKEREKYCKSVNIQVGLNYFGGKKSIGKRILKMIFDMQAIRAIETQQPASVFVDAFTGGGKIGLSIPLGWFDVIVMNDLDYGVYAFYKCCQECPGQLIEMIEILSEIMNGDTFKMFNEHREDGKDNDCIANRIKAGAMTFWVTQASWDGHTDAQASYRFREGDTTEKALIEQAVETARRRIWKINKRFQMQQYIILNEKYQVLINDYTKHHLSTYVQYEKVNKAIETDGVIWYFDPPYLQDTLSLGKPADYEHTFKREDTVEMTKLIEDVTWFIKSDYDPKYLFKDYAKIKQSDNTKENQDKYTVYHIFDSLEDAEKGFFKECLGKFRKGSDTTKKEEKNQNKKETSNKNKKEPKEEKYGCEMIWGRLDGKLNWYDIMVRNNNQYTLSLEENTESEDE